MAAVAVVERRRWSHTTTVTRPISPNRIPWDPVASVEPFPVVRVARIEVNDTEPAWLIQSLWGAESVGFIGGTPKSFKTWMALELAVAVASGRPCLGRFEVENPGHVLVYAAEDSAADIRRRVASIAEARRVELPRLAVGLITEPVLQLDRPSHQLRLSATLAKLKPKMLVLDPLVRLHRQGRLELHAEHRSHAAPKPMGVELATKPEHIVVSDLGDDAVPDEGAELQRRVFDAIKAGPITRAALRERMAIRNERLGRVLSQLEADGVVARIGGLLSVPDSRA